MQSTAITARKLTTGLALGLALTVAGSGTAAAATHADGKGAAKVERVASKGGTKSAHSKMRLKAVKRQLKQSGMRAHRPAGAPKKMNRAGCTITYYSDGALGICNDPYFSWWNEVYVDFYGDAAGWIYWGYFVS
jgi:hypothetical protein